MPGENAPGIVTAGAGAGSEMSENACRRKVLNDDPGKFNIVAAFFK
jgi:hypothetical protein